MASGTAMTGITRQPLAIVMSSMAFIPGMAEQLYPSLGLLVALLIALMIRRVLRGAFA